MDQEVAGSNPVGHPKETVKIKAKDFYWLAGLLEGKGRALSSRVLLLNLTRPESSVPCAMKMSLHGWPTCSA